MVKIKKIRVKSPSKKMILSIFILWGMIFFCSNIVLAEDYKSFEKSLYNEEQIPMLRTDLSSNSLPFSSSQPQTLRLEGIDDDDDALGVEEIPISNGLLILVELSIIYLVLKKKLLYNTSNKQ